MTILLGALVTLAFAAFVVWVAWLARPRVRPAGTAPTRVVIVGGGFGGVFAASELERALGARDDIEVLLISRENYFVFQPMLPEVISGTIGLTDVVSPLRRLLPRTTIHVREVEAIDVEKKQVWLAPGAHPHAHAVPFDHLIVAPGTVTDFRGLPGLPEHALPFKNLADALELRSRVIGALEEAAIEGAEHPELRRQLLTFVVAGGGFSGVEVVAELNDFVRDVARSYRGLDASELRVVLVHAGERILPEVSEKLGRYAQRLLRERGVEIRLGVRLQSASGDRAVLSDGSVIASKTLVSTIPSSPHPLVDALALPKARGKLKVDAQLRIEGETHVWALGDCALVPTADGQPCPPTAQHAVRQARTLARNLLATIDGTPLASFDFKGLGKMGALGRHNAVAEIFGLNVSGFLAWFLWRTIYLAKLPGWGRRAKVAAAWTFDLVLPPELVQLHLGGPAGAVHQRFEPGETVFRQGDLGDRIYIVLAGKAEVVRQNAVGDQVLAQVGPGEFFGEMALLNSLPRNATVRCLEATTVLGIPKREFGLLAANLPGLKQSFEQVMRTRMGAAPAAAERN